MKTVIRMILFTALLAVALTMVVFTMAGFGAEAATEEGATGTLVLAGYGGSVAVFDDGDRKTPLQVMDIELDTLRAADRALVERGIKIESREALMALLEDLGS